MKSIAILISLTLASWVSLADTDKTNKKGDQQNKTITTEVILEMEEALSLDDCVDCPVEVQLFDKDFNLIYTGKRRPLEETKNPTLNALLAGSQLIMMSDQIIVYQLQ